MSSRLAALCFVIVGALVTGCGIQMPFVPTPTPDRFGEIEITEPPEMTINGVAGKPITWCWATACVDGRLPEPEGLPLVSPPFVMELPAGARIDGVFAYLENSTEPMPLRWTDQVVGPVPDAAVTLTVFLQLAPSGDALYAWQIESGSD